MQAQHAIQLDLDGELPWLKRRALRRHVAGCVTCGEALRQHGAIRRAMSQLAVMGIEPGLARQANGRQGRRRLQRLRPLMAVAAAVALCVGAWWALAGLRSQPREHIAEHRSPTRSQPVPANASDAQPTGPLAAQTPDPRSLVHVEFSSSSDVITIPKPTKNPNVTILWVYPAVRTAEAPSEAPLVPDTSLEGAQL